MNKEDFIKKLEDIEWEDFEVKEALAEVPKSSWETVSAFNCSIIKTTNKTTNKRVGSKKTGQWVVR